MGDHHHVSRNNILKFDDLAELFGARDDLSAPAQRDIRGERYHLVLSELAQIVAHQWQAGTRRGLIKGFFLSGPPGTGKTTLAQRLAYEMALREAARPDGSSVVMAMIDGGEIARSRYGESEERIRDIFLHAKAGFTAANQRSIILFDDVESIFMARGNANAKEWHFSQDSVFFHAVDELDTSRATLVLTSNRPDLVDAAIRDRFLAYDIGYPDQATLIEIAGNIAAQQDFSAEQKARLEAALCEAIAGGLVRSIREAQRFVVRHQLGEVLGRPSLASESGLLGE